MIGQQLAAAQAKLVVEVWPENWPTWQLFASLLTQWRTAGMGARTGLAYEALYPLLDRMHLSDAEWEQMFEDVQVMEGEALSVMHAN